MLDLATITGFNWDDGNARKNERHGVSMAEAEQVFFNAPLLLLGDAAHSQKELRLHALGQTDERRMLHITFTSSIERVDPRHFSQGHAPKGESSL
jgi:uncharacterized DUF497 family protein